MFQQVGYKNREFGKWLMNHLYSRVVTTEHIFFNILIFVMIYLLISRVTQTAGVIIVTTFTVFWFLDVSGYREEKEKKPLVFTPRMQRLGMFPLLFLGLLWLVILDVSYRGVAIQDFAAPFIRTDPYFLSFGLVVVDMAVPFLVMFAAWLLTPVERQIQNKFKKRARQKLASLPDLKVIAITGSYGKTSTKFAIEAFLKERFQVCVTPGSYNTPMGICKVINNDLEAFHQVLILEMGARYRGNIKELCDIARPDIAVITNVGLSHLETFGSVHAVAGEKATLARELKPGGTLILNGGDERVKKMALLRDDVKTVFAGSEGTVQARGIITGPEGTAFKMVWENGETEEEKITTRLLGLHHVANMVLAAAVAKELGIRLRTVALAASTMKPVEHRLELKTRNGLTVIDDAFNSNPVGAKNAVDVLASFTGGRKIIITPGMIELGEQEAEENERFGKHIALAGIDLAILVGREQTRPIFTGIESEKKDGVPEVRIVQSLFEANDVLNEYARPGDVVLYENDLPDTYSE